MKFYRDHRFYTVVLSIVVSFAFVATIAYSATTISTNVNTGGTLTVTGVSTLTGAVYATSTLQVTGVITSYGGVVHNENGAAVDLRVEGDTVTDLFLVDGSADRVGIASTTPWATFSVEQNGTDKPFVIGSSATSTPLLIVDGKGNVGIASTTPAAKLGVVGDVYVGSSATTTIYITSTDTTKGGCFEMEDAADVTYRVFISKAGAMTVQAGTCK